MAAYKRQRQGREDIHQEKHSETKRGFRGLARYERWVAEKGASETYLLDFEGKIIVARRRVRPRAPTS